MTAEFDSAGLVSSLRAAGVWISPDAFTLRPCEGMGVGAVASRGLESGTPLFHLPLSALLTPWTSGLRDALCTAPGGTSGDTTAWDALAPHGWARLMLAMMYEESRGAASPWASYLANMPREFDTPIWWSEGDLALLQGTDIADRIGKATADEQYTTVIAPLLASRPDLFGGDRQRFFTLHNYHVQGSRILSRSFTVPVSRAGGPPQPEGDEADDSDDEDEEDDTVAVMVPMADMLNAAYGRNNARLFADDDDDEEVPDADAQQFGEGYTMITTQTIPSGEQIFNTYASPPNAELLRKYGYVDEPALPPHILSQLIPAEVGEWPRGNAADEVEVPGDLVVAAAAGNADALRDRVDFWLEEGQEDTFWLAYPDPEDGAGADSLPPALVAFARLLTSDEAWARAQRKGKLPNPTLDAAAAQLLLDAIDARAAKYPQTISDDLAVVTAGTPGNAHNAAAVRLGEKRVLGLNRRIVASELERLSQSANGRDHPTDDDRAAKRRK